MWSRWARRLPRARLLFQDAVNWLQWLQWDNVNRQVPLDLDFIQLVENTVENLIHVFQIDGCLQLDPFGVFTAGNHESGLRVLIGYRGFELLNPRW